LLDPVTVTLVVAGPVTVTNLLLLDPVTVTNLLLTCY